MTTMQYLTVSKNKDRAGMKSEIQEWSEHSRVCVCVAGRV